MNESIFFDAWRDCLRAHYIHVLRAGDVLNEASLYTVLRDTGFTDDEVGALQAEFAQVSEVSTDDAISTEMIGTETNAETDSIALLADPVMTEEASIINAVVADSVPPEAEVMLLEASISFASTEPAFNDPVLSDEPPPLVTVQTSLLDLLANADPLDPLAKPDKPAPKKPKKPVQKSLF